MFSGRWLEPGSSGRGAHSHESHPGNLRCVPAAAERLDQQHARVHSALQDIQVISLIVEGSGLPGDDLQIGIDSTFVSGLKKIERLLRGGGGLTLLLRFAFRARAKRPGCPQPVERP